MLSATKLSMMFNDLKQSTGEYMDIPEFLESIKYKNPEKEMVIDATVELMEYLKTLEEKEKDMKSDEEACQRYAEYYMTEYLNKKEARVAVTNKIAILKQKMKSELPKCDECGCECDDEEQDD